MLIIILSLKGCKRENIVMYYSTELGLADNKHKSLKASIRRDSITCPYAYIVLVFVLLISFRLLSDHDVDTSHTSAYPSSRSFLLDVSLACFAVYAPQSQVFCVLEPITLDDAGQRQKLAF